jgi:hypothetical protein
LVVTREGGFSRGEQPSRLKICRLRSLAGIAKEKDKQLTKRTEKA